MTEEQLMNLYTLTFSFAIVLVVLLLSRRKKLKQSGPVICRLKWTSSRYVATALFVALVLMDLVLPLLSDRFDGSSSSLFIPGFGLLWLFIRDRLAGLYQEGILLFRGPVIEWKYIIGWRRISEEEFCFTVRYNAEKIVEEKLRNHPSQAAEIDRILEQYVQVREPDPGQQVQEGTYDDFLYN